jgi:uncharacterized protein
VIDPQLLSVLVCPACEDRPPLREEGEYLVCTKVGHGFPVVNGLPHLLLEHMIEPDKLKELLRANA